MSLVALIFVVLSALLMAAHFLRAGSFGWVMFSLSAPLLLLIRRNWALKSLQVMLVASALVWLWIIRDLIFMRQALAQPWLRMALILASVALIPLLAAKSLNHRVWQHYQRQSEKWLPATMVFSLLVVILALIQHQVSRPMLILERLIPGTGAFEILLLAAYAAWMTEKLLDPTQSAAWRRRLWLLFSLVFFAQLLLGLAGLEQFLMTGKLHWPIPALIVAGLIYRAGGYFMFILFAATVLLVGPAWCSHLCYVGVWDNLAADRQRKPLTMPGWRHGIRFAVLLCIILTAFVLRWAGASPTLASGLALAFGLVGVAVILLWSRKRCVMTHCITYCPIGLLANWLGKISPFRIRIDSSCSECGACRMACRYDALNWAEIQARRPNSLCTLCGDCLGFCPHSSLGYRFLGLSPERARTVFVAVVVTLHTVFLAVARI